MGRGPPWLAFTDLPALYFSVLCPFFTSPPFLPEAFLELARQRGTLYFLLAVC